MTPRVGGREWDSTTIPIDIIKYILELKNRFLVALHNILILQLTPYTIWGQWDLNPRPPAPQAYTFLLEVGILDQARR